MLESNNEEQPLKKIKTQPETEHRNVLPVQVRNDDVFKYTLRDFEQLMKIHSKLKRVNYQEYRTFYYHHLDKDYYDYHELIPKCKAEIRQYEKFHKEELRKTFHSFRVALIIKYSAIDKYCLADDYFSYIQHLSPNVQKMIYLCTCLKNNKIPDKEFNTVWSEYIKKINLSEFYEIMTFIDNPLTNPSRHQVYQSKDNFNEECEKLFNQSISNEHILK